MINALEIFYPFHNVISINQIYQMAGPITHFLSIPLSPAVCIHHVVANELGELHSPPRNDLPSIISYLGVYCIPIVPENQYSKPISTGQAVVRHHGLGSWRSEEKNVEEAIVTWAFEPSTQYHDRLRDSSNVTRGLATIHTPPQDNPGYGSIHLAQGCDMCGEQLINPDWVERRSSQHHITVCKPHATSRSVIS